MLENAQRMLRNASVLDSLEANKEKELRNLDRGYAAILNFDDFKDSLTKAYESSKKGIEATFDALMMEYKVGLNKCEHEIIFYIEDEGKYVCVCCNQQIELVDTIDNAIIINITSEQYNSSEFIKELRDNLITYLFFVVDKNKEEIKKEIPTVLSSEEEIKLLKKKKGDRE